MKTLNFYPETKVKQPQSVVNMSRGSERRSIFDNISTYAPHDLRFTVKNDMPTFCTKFAEQPTIVKLHKQPGRE